MPTLFEDRKRGRRDPGDAVYLSEIEPPGKRNRLIFDEHRNAPRGFGVRVTPKGKVSFVLRYNIEGKDRLTTIGERGTWTLTAARKRASEIRREVDSGTDVVDERRQQRAELTVSDVTERFCKARTDALASGRAVRQMLARHLVPALGKRKITSVRRGDVIALVDEIATDRPREAGKLLAYVKQIFAYAEDREFIEVSPVASLKASKVSKGLTARSRARVLSEEEIRQFWTGVEGCGMRRLTALALKLVLLTGQRPGEVCGITPDEVRGHLWTIPAARRRKTETAHTVPLSGTASAILEEARGIVGDDAPCLFPSRTGDALTVSGLDQSVRRFAETLGSVRDPDWGHWRPHDLRRTMRTGLSAAGVSDTVAELTIGHTRKGIAAVYDLHRYDAEKRAALEAWERRLLRIIHGQPADDNVVTLTGAR